jgi:hypothetical protein
MRPPTLLILLFCIILVLLTSSGPGFAEEHVIVVIIDGARYTETLGSPTREFTPRMGRLAENGTIVDPMLNDGETYTSRAVPALWSGSWAAPHDTLYNGINTQCTIIPSMFEYYRKQKNAPRQDCYYVLKDIYSLWLPSFHPEYGPDYWPEYHSAGVTDIDVFEEAKAILQTDQPSLMWLYFADVDHEGHSGVWENYTRAIAVADSLVGELWDLIQSDAHYRNKTALIVTNDHGRHDDSHPDGFSGHGDRCLGCRQIMFLAVGPSFRENHTSTQPRYIPDIAVTAASLLGVEMTYSSGNIMGELFNSSGVSEPPAAMPADVLLFPPSPNPTNASAILRYSLSTPSSVTLAVYDLLGRRVALIERGFRSPGTHRADWDAGELPSGAYLVVLDTRTVRRSARIVVVK